jgi:1-deoxy-D-xylulose-5-phosphate reductoisomerase
MQTITILGATGSIGSSTLDVVARHPDRFQITALTANTQVAELAQLCVRFRPAYACIAERRLAADLTQQLRAAGVSTKVLAGDDGLVEAASLPEVDTVMAAIVGAAGLRATLAAARAGKKVLLANKEALVSAGPVFMETVARHGAKLLPIDSEHNAIFQCLPPFATAGKGHYGIRKILLTGSGGPFRRSPRAELSRVTPKEACAHPNWSMGRKISVDSATMMNKGLEVIEARWLFDATPDQIEVVVHPQSVVHSMVEYTDGSVIAQLGNPDMRTPIAQALAFPERIEAGVERLDLFQIAKLEFERPDFERFPALRLAYAALRAGGSTPCVLNAANEIAVAAFLEGSLPFLGITALIEETLAKLPSVPLGDIDEVVAADADARAVATRILQRLSSDAA